MLPHTVSENLVVPESSYTSLLFKNASQHPNKIAVVNGLTGEEFRYCEMLNFIAKVSSGLWKLGLRQNHIVCIIDINSPEYLFARHGVLETGAALTYTNPASTEYELLSLFTVSKPKMIFTSSGYVDKVASAAKQTNCGEIIFLFDGGCGPQKDTSPYKSFSKYLLEDNGSESRLFAKDIVVDPKCHLAELPFSSGTTGLPKGVMLSHYNLCANMLQLQASCDVQPDEVVLMALPMFHISAILTQSLTFYTGNKLVLLPKFEPNSYLNTIDKYEVNYLHANPPIILFLVQSTLTEEYDLRSLKRVLYGGAPMKKEVEEQFFKKYQNRKINIDCCQVYGLTEASPIVMYSSPSSKNDSIGTLFPGIQFKVVDCQTGTTLGPNCPGELWLKGPNIMMGYYNNPMATKECLTEDGWLKTGDMIYYDEDEYFYYMDRIKELIKCNGFNVPPAELENLLLTHSSVKDAAVIGRPHENLGEVPVAFVVRKDATLSEEDVMQFIADRLIDFKHLRGGVHFIDEIPKSASGKILRKDLRSLFYPQ